VLAGTDFFMEKYPVNIKDPAFLNELTAKVSPVKVALFYIKHPARFLGKLQFASENGYKLIQGYGNYEKADNVVFKKTVESFRCWNDFKLKALPHSLLFTGIFFGGFLLAVLVVYARTKTISGRLYLETFLLVEFIGITQFIIPIIGDGDADISRHLFLFNVCFDLMFIFGSVHLVQLLYRVIGKTIRLLPLKAGNSIK
jgi:hypothetical protein